MNSTSQDVYVSTRSTIVEAKQATREREGGKGRVGRERREGRRETVSSTHRSTISSTKSSSRLEFDDVRSRDDIRVRSQAGVGVESVPGGAGERGRGEEES